MRDRPGDLALAASDDLMMTSLAQLIMLEDSCWLDRYNASCADASAKTGAARVEECDDEQACCPRTPVQPLHSTSAPVVYDDDAQANPAEDHSIARASVPGGSIAEFLDSEGNPSALKVTRALWSRAVGGGAGSFSDPALNLPQDEPGP
jgi:hypothetical protein